MDTKKLYYQDKNDNETHSRAWEVERQHVQTVVDIYNQTGLPPLGKGNLHLLVNDTVNFLYDKLTGGNDAHLSVGTGNDVALLPVIKSKAIEMLQKPKGYNELLEGIKELGVLSMKGIRHNGDVVWGVRDIAKYFDLSADGEVEYTESLKKSIADRGNYFVSNEHGKKVLAFLEEVTKAYYENGIDKIRYPNTDWHGVGQIFIDGVDKMDHKNKTWRLRKEFGGILERLGLL